jgi:hypothetical protein
MKCAVPTDISKKKRQEHEMVARTLHLYDKRRKQMAIDGALPH